MPPANDPAAITAQQRASWDRSVDTYTEVVISKDPEDLATLQVILTIKTHKELKAGLPMHLEASVLSASESPIRLRSLPTGDKILDIASSSGRPAVPLAKEFPHVQVTSTDLSPKSSSLVRKYAETQSVTNVTAQAADAQDLRDFADSTFSVVTCTYGLFFMPETAKALKEILRVLQPGGLLVATSWAWPDKVQMSEIFMRTMSILSGEPVPTDPVAALPWEVGNPRNLPQVMTNIGFQNAICTAYEHPLHVELSDMVKLVAGPDGQFAPMLDRMKAGRDSIYQEAAQAVHQASTEIGKVEGGIVHLENNALLFTATKP